MRWCRGNLQVFLKEGGRLLAGLAGKNGLSCLDLLLSIPPAIVLTVCGVLAGAALTVLELIAGGPVLPLLRAALTSFAVPYLLLFLAGGITTLTQWRRYVPITIMALLGKVEWKPIEHRAVMSVQELK